jgi:membrane-associated protease RseP (regulator of RpoE activity)
MEDAMTVIFILLAGLAALVIHEGGHYLAACVFGIRTKGIVVDKKGIAIVRERGPWFDCMVVSLAGPLLNVGFAFAWPHGMFMLANLCLGLVNLVPLQNSDGARVLECLFRIENARAFNTRRNGNVDPVKLDSIFDELAASPVARRVYVSVNSQADAEKLYERLFHAGADTSRVTICVQ